jgi:hypothetical protein
MIDFLYNAGYNRKYCFCFYIFLSGGISITMKKRVNLFRLFSGAAVLLCALLLSACAWLETVDNNDLTIPDLINYFKTKGVDIQSVSLIRRDVVHADDAVSIMIADREIGIYKFNKKLKRERDKIEKAELEGFIYLVGDKKPVIINGSFLLVGYDTNPQEKQIVEVFKSFK